MNRKWFDDPDYVEHLMFQREADDMQREREMNTPVGKWAPADFLYDPLKNHEEKFS